MENLHNQGFDLYLRKQEEIKTNKLLSNYENGRNPLPKDDVVVENKVK